MRTQFLGDLIIRVMPSPSGLGTANSSFLPSSDMAAILANDHVSPALSSFLRTNTISPTLGGEGSDCLVGHFDGLELIHMIELAKCDMKTETICWFCCRRYEGRDGSNVAT